MTKSKHVYRCCGTGLGDIIGGLMLYLRQSIEHKEIVRVATWYPRGGGKVKDYKSKAEEITALIDSPGKIELTDEIPTRVHPKDAGIANPFYRTKIVWKPNSNKLVAYQFDGKSHKYKNFPSVDDEKEVVEFIQSLGYETIKLGWHLSLEACVKILSECHSYVGVPSGIGVLAYAVGTPYIMIRHRLGKQWLSSVRYGPFILLKDKYEYFKIFRLFHEQGLEFFKRWCLNKDLLFY